MNNFQIRSAEKSKTKLKIGLAGPSGSGKTYSALLLASGFAPWKEICVIDTENGSADLYDNLGGYNVITLTPPFSPERYIEAIRAAEEAGMKVIIIDSISHEWSGKGGILEIHDQMTNRNDFSKWAELTPRHNAFIDAMLYSKAHVIATMRTKQDYVISEQNGKHVPEKIGLKAITREGVDYEFTITFDLDIKHNANTTKDRTGLFMDKPEFFISRETGEILKEWSEKGRDLDTERGKAVNTWADQIKGIKTLKSLNKLRDKMREEARELRLQRTDEISITINTLFEAKEKFLIEQEAQKKKDKPDQVKLDEELEKKIDAIEKRRKRGGKK
jgi:hypothetical protein